MVKALSFLSLLAALAVAAFLWSQQSSRVRSDAPIAILQAAQTALELNRRITGTYAGTMTPDVEVVRADATSYCVEAAGWHLAGPGGTPTGGACPR